MSKIWTHVSWPGDLIFISHVCSDVVRDLTEKLHLGWAWCDGRGHRERETAQVNKGENTGMAARKLIKDGVEKGRKLEVLSQM